MAEPVTISFVGTSEIKVWLEEWAKEDERSISFILRKILKQEIMRRTSDPSLKTQKQTSTI